MTKDLKPSRSIEVVAKPIVQRRDPKSVANLAEVREQLAKVLDEREDAVAVRGRAVALRHPIFTAPVF